jgi:hypothetical protein
MQDENGILLGFSRYIFVEGVTQFDVLPELLWTPNANSNSRPLLKILQTPPVSGEV